MRYGKWIAVLALFALAAVSSTSNATITDDINPQDFTVQVGLSNPDPVGYSGTVEVVVDIGGSTTAKVVPFVISAGGTGSVTATFKDQVVQVVSVKITEEPDPF